MTIIVLTPIIGARQARIGRKNVITLGYLAAVIGCGAFGMLSHVENE